jgi:hypothetical protein
MTACAQDSDLCKPVPAKNRLHPLARYHQKHRPMAADRPTSNRRNSEEMGMAGSHTSKTSIKHHTTVPDMDTSRKEESREATPHLAKRSRGRCEVDRTNMGQLNQTAKNRQRWRAVVNGLSPGGAKGLRK